MPDGTNNRTDDRSASTDTPEGVVVTQADRDAAELTCAIVAARIRRSDILGLSNEIAETFARHRLAHTAAPRTEEVERRSWLNPDTNEQAIRAQRYGSCGKCGAPNGQCETRGVFCLNPNCARDAAKALASLPPSDVHTRQGGEAERDLLTGAGWVAWNPDTGEEYSPQHPIESGECVEARNVRRSTPQEDVLWAGMQAEFQRAERAATPTAPTQTEEAGGTFACPICGQDTPHHHTPAVVEAYQNKRSRT